MYFERKRYLEQLINHKNNGLVKVVTGIRRSGKSFLLFEIFYRHLKSIGVDDQHIIRIDLEDRRNKSLRDPDSLLAFIDNKMIDNGMYYIILDEVQMVHEFEDVLNSYNKVKNADIYVTGSNSRFLSKDVITEFRGRGDEIRIHPLSLSEVWEAMPELSWEQMWQLYMTYGGLPLTIQTEKNTDKAAYLKSLFEETYIKDIKDRNHVQNDIALETILNIASSSIGSLTNPQKLEKTFRSIGNTTLSAQTIKNYLEYLEDAFLISKASRYDIKGKRYISTPYKYYFTDMGLRNARVNFRQIEETHIMENIIYNELILRGYNVDVGVVEIRERDANGKEIKKQVEVDFVVNQGSERFYIQSVYALPSPEKMEQEVRPFLNINDAFKRIVIVKEDILLRRNDMGIVTMGLREFLVNNNSLYL